MAINHYTRKDKWIIAITIVLTIIAIILSSISHSYNSADKRTSYNMNTNTIPLYR